MAGVYTLSTLQDSTALAPVYIVNTLVTTKISKSSNLADVPDKSAARFNLGTDATGTPRPPISHGHPASQIAGLHAVATSGSFNDLLNKPVIPTVLVTSVAGRIGNILLSTTDVAGITNYALTTDTRFTNSRTPLPHVHDINTDVTGNLPMSRIVGLEGKILYIGSYKIVDLPAASLNQAHYAFVTDLGGGPDMVISDGTAWKHIRRGSPGPMTAATNISVTPLVSPTIVILSGTINSASQISINTQNIYAGYEITVTVPANTLGLLGTLGVKILGSPNAVLPILNGTWADYSYNGTSLVKVRGGSL